MSTYYRVYIKGQGEIIGELNRWGEVLAYKRDGDTAQVALKRQNTLSNIISQVRRGINNCDENELVIVDKNDKRMAIKDIERRKIKRRPNLSSVEKKTIFDMRERGFTPTQIATLLGISCSTIKKQIIRGKSTPQTSNI